MRPSIALAILTLAVIHAGSAQVVPPDLAVIRTGDSEVFLRMGRTGDTAYIEIIKRILDEVK